MPRPLVRHRAGRRDQRQIAVFARTLDWARLSRLVGRLGVGGNLRFELLNEGSSPSCQVSPASASAPSAKLSPMTVASR